MQTIYFILTPPGSEQLTTLAINAVRTCHTASGLTDPTIYIAKKTEAVVRVQGSLKWINFGEQTGLDLIKFIITELLKNDWDNLIILNNDTVLTNPPLWFISGNDLCGFFNAGSLAVNNKAFGITRELLETIYSKLNSIVLDAIAPTLLFGPTICNLAATYAKNAKIFPPAAKNKLFIGQFYYRSFSTDEIPLYVMDCSGGGWVNDVASVNLSAVNAIFLAMRATIRKSKIKKNAK